MKAVITLPYVCLRALVLFPEACQDIAAGRSVSKVAIQAARSTYDNRLIAVTQRQVEREDNITPADLYQVGTLCSVEASVGLADLLRVRVTGVQVVTLSNFRIEKNVQVVDAVPLESHKYSSADWSSRRTAIVNALQTLDKQGGRGANESLHSLLLENSSPLFIVQTLAIIRTLLKKRLGQDPYELIPIPEDEETQKILNKFFEQQQKILECPDPVQQLVLLQSVIEINKS